MSHNNTAIATAMGRRKHILKAYQFHLEMLALNGSGDEVRRATQDCAQLELIFKRLSEDEAVDQEALRRRMHIIQDFRNLTDMTELLDSPAVQIQIAKFDCQVLENLFDALTPDGPLKLPV